MSLPFRGACATAYGIRAERDYLAWQQVLDGNSEIHITSYEQYRTVVYVNVRNYGKEVTVVLDAGITATDWMNTGGTFRLKAGGFAMS